MAKFRKLADAFPSGPWVRVSIGGPNGEPTDCPCGCDRRDGGTGFYISVGDGEDVIVVNLTEAEAAKIRKTGVADIEGKRLYNGE